MTVKLFCIFAAMHSFAPGTVLDVKNNHYVESQSVECDILQHYNETVEELTEQYVRMRDKLTQILIERLGVTDEKDIPVQYFQGLEIWYANKKMRITKDV